MQVGAANRASELAEVGLKPNRCGPRSSYQKQQRLVVFNAHIAVQTGGFQMALGFGQRTDGNLAEPREIAVRVTAEAFRNIGGRRKR